MENKIVLFVENGSWMAQYKGNHRQQIIDLFGTDTIPTAFIARTNRAVVKREIERLNPSVNVVTL